MFLIMYKRNKFIVNIKKYKPKKPKLVIKKNTLEEARKFIEGTSYYIQYDNEEVRKFDGRNVRIEE